MGFFQKLFGGNEPPQQETAPIRLFAPVAGQAVSIEQVSDPTFGEKILGDGVAIQPSDGKVFAPCDCTVDLMFDTGHAVSLISDSGVEILIHTGLDTTKLKGKHYTVHTHSGDTVKQGQLLMEFDVAAVAAEGYDTITPIVICNTADYSRIQAHLGPVAPGDLILELSK